jgi:hypothetical protein
MRDLLRGILAVIEYHKVILQNLHYTNHQWITQVQCQISFKFETISAQKN